MMAQIISSTSARKRAAMLSSLRRGLDKYKFLEVTTPVLLKVEAGSPAPMHPFTVGNCTYDLRNSIELLLRTALAVAPRVYDIGPAIRFEDATKIGRSAVEFTLLEFFASDLRYEELIRLVENLLREAVPDLSSTIQYIKVVDWFAEQWGISFDTTTDRSTIRDTLAKIASMDADTPLWELIDQVVSSHLEPSLEGLVFLTDYPIETICLAKRATDSHIAERFEVYLNGYEIGHGFMDAIDADDVLSRMKENGQRFVDQAFVDLLRSGTIPASGGFGLGIERLLAASEGANSDIRGYLHAYQHC